MGSWSIWHWLIFGGIIYVLYSMNRNYRGSSKPMVCKSCGFVGGSKTLVRGNLAIEIILWLCLLVPGLIYSIWRGSSRYSVCPQCGGKEMIPADSPVGKAVLASGEKLAAPSAAGVSERREERACPHCAEPILTKAKVCKHCGRDVAPPPH